MELVVAVLAGELGQAAICCVEHTVADAAVFNTIHLLVNVLLPEEDGGNDVSVT